MPLLNCETEIDLLWSKECIIPEISIAPRIAGNPNAKLPFQDIEERQTIGATSQIDNAQVKLPNTQIKSAANIR